MENNVIGSSNCVAKYNLVYNKTSSTKYVSNDSVLTVTLSDINATGQCFVSLTNVYNSAWVDSDYHWIRNIKVGNTAISDRAYNHYVFTGEGNSSYTNYTTIQFLADFTNANTISFETQRGWYITATVFQLF